MLNRLDVGALRNRLQGVAAITLGLAVIVASLVYLVPRQAEIAAAVTQARREAAQAAIAERERQAAAAIDPAPRENATAAAAAPPPETAAAQDLTLASLEPADVAPPAATPQILARPVALDTATILIRRGKVKLSGIAPVPLSQRCGEGPNEWFCGVEARTQFRAWLRARSISCNVPEHFGETTQEIDATCSLAGQDIARWLVERGWATAAADGPYADAERQAKSKAIGVWAMRRGDS